MNQYIANFLKGIGVGSANVIPGVSGGTIALITAAAPPANTEKPLKAPTKPYLPKSLKD